MFGKKSLKCLAHDRWSSAWSIIKEEEKLYVKTEQYGIMIYLCWQRNCFHPMHLREHIEKGDVVDRKHLTVKHKNTWMMTRVKESSNSTASKNFLISLLAKRKLLFPHNIPGRYVRVHSVYSTKIGKKRVLIRLDIWDIIKFLREVQNARW